MGIIFVVFDLVCCELKAVVTALAFGGGPQLLDLDFDVNLAPKNRRFD